MGKLSFGAGSVSFTMSDDFNALVRQVLDQALPGVVDRVDAAAERVYTQAVERAPVRTGDFKASIERETRVAPDLSSIRGRVFSELDYAKYIRSPRLPGSGSAFVELLRKPIELEGAKLVAEIRDVLDRVGD